VAGDRERLGCLVPIPPLAVIERAANKVDIMQTAEGLGVPVPRGSVVVGPDGVAGLQLEFPVVIKPWRSRVRCDGRWHALSVSYAANRDELDRDLRDRPPYAFPLLLQERIEGPGIGIFACFDSGRPVAMFGHRRLRERPPWGGVSVLSESIALDPDTASHATRLLASIGWQGPAMVEFKVDVRDGLPKLMEINGRFWGSLQLAVDAGVDFPALALQALRDEPFPLQRPYRVGIQSRWLWGDVDSLMLSLRARTRARMPASAPGRLAAIGTFLKLWGRDLYYDNPKWSDPWPWVVETSSRLAVLGRFLHRSPARPITPGPSAPQVGV
jgi:predicted ATP-grasp superfamily ATP-dependent carboligase